MLLELWNSFDYTCSKSSSKLGKFGLSLFSVFLQNFFDVREQKYKTLIFNSSITREIMINTYELCTSKKIVVEMLPWTTGSKHFSIEALYFAHELRLSPRILLDMASVGLHNPRQDSGTSESSQHFVAIASTSATPIHKRILYYYSLNQWSGWRI